MELPKRKSPRADWYDYAGGMYFVTVVTRNRNKYFGEINNGVMSLNSLGAFLDTELQNIQQHYHYARLINHVVMPNHFHAIIYIEENMLPKKLKSVEKVFESNNPLEKAHLAKNWLSTIVGGIKSCVTRYANNNSMKFSWQTRYHDHIIRGNRDFDLISKYIDSNTANWDLDCFNAP
jgi:REP element-mobilizing transposase RayT